MSTSENQSSLPIRRGRKRKFLLIFGIVSLLTISAGAAYYWWSNRPITPQTLDQQEQLALDSKVAAVQEERTYEPGEKTLTLTEKEINALFHQNTGMGDKVRFELANNAVHARIRTELDEDLPGLGGRTLKAKARFKLTDDQDNPAIILDDLTLWGISLPNAWLAELKGQNLISNLGIDLSENQIAKGVKDINVDHGKITIHLAE